MLSKKMNAETKARRSNLLWMLASISLLIVIGLENILSSTFVLDGGSTVYGYLLKQLGFLVMGLLASAGVWHLGYPWLRRWCGTLVLISALLLGFVNAIIRPVLVLVTLPITLLTLGLFTLVINALMFWAVSGLVAGFVVPDFWTAFWGALLYSLLTWLVSLALSDRDD